MSINSLNWEHLTDKKDLIRAGIYTVQDFLWGTVKYDINTGLSDKQTINIFWDKVSHDVLNILSRWDRTYCISDCNSLPKYSYWYMDCTWVAIVGTDSESWEQISILTHEDPEYFFKTPENQKSFEDDLCKRMSLIKERSKKWTIDAVVFWWYFRYDELSFAYVKYLRSLKLLNDLITEELDFPPVMIAWPNLDWSNDALDVFLDTQNRRLHLIRPFQKHNEANFSFNLDWISKMDYYLFNNVLNKEKEI